MALLAILRRCLGLLFILSSVFGLHGPPKAHGASKRCVPLLRAEWKEGKKAAKGKGLGLRGLEREKLSPTQRHSESATATP